MIRVLHVLGDLSTGGTECLIMNWYRNIDRTEVQFDFLIRGKSDNFVDEIHRLGGNIYYTSKFPRHIFKNYRETKNVLEMKKWDIIHVHANAAIYLTALLLAKKFDMPSRIMHSHNVETKKLIYKYIHYINRKLVNKLSTYRIACSSNAGEWMYGKKDYKVLKNGLNINEYIFDKKERENIRQEFDLQDKFVVGNIGRFTRQKNHRFLLEIFKEIKKVKKDSVLLLVGEGENKSEIKKQAELLGIEDAIIFAGKRNDIGKVLSAMDVFVFPSLFEGLGNVLIEAQINGLHCFASTESVNPEVRITSNLQDITLNENPKVWTNHILKADYDIKQRFLSNELLEESGYDIRKVVSELTKVYEKEVQLWERNFL